MAMTLDLSTAEIEVLVGAIDLYRRVCQWNKQALHATEMEKELARLRITMLDDIEMKLAVAAA